MVKNALKKRRHQPMLLVDIAVPRDIEPTVGKLADVYMYTIDDLTMVLDGNRQLRAAAAADAELIIANHIAQFEQWLNLRKGSVILKRFREHAALTSEQLVAQAQQQLANGQAADSVVERLAHQLSRRLLHLPTKHIRDTIMQGDFQRARQLQSLFLGDATSDLDEIEENDDSPQKGHTGDSC